LATHYPIAIYGGKKGDKLDKKRGAFMADVVHEGKKLNFIFDFSEWNDFEMQLWMADFLNRIFEIHSADRVPLHLFVEEAEVFFPQVNYDEGRNSLLAGNKVMKRGRALGLGMTLISQRPQDVNKKTLSQCQAHFLLHLEGVPEMKVVNEMLRSEDKETREELVKAVKNARPGEVVLYSPQWLGKAIKFKFRIRESFHAGYTPKFDEVVTEPELVKQVRPVIEEVGKEESSVSKGLTTKQLIAGVIFGLTLYVVSTVI